MAQRPVERTFLQYGIGVEQFMRHAPLWKNGREAFPDTMNKESISQNARFHQYLATARELHGAIS